MGFNLQEIRKIATFMKRNGVLDLKVGDLEIKVSESALTPKKPRRTKKEIPIAGITEPLTPEDILLWSVNH